MHVRRQTSAHLLAVGVEGDEGEAVHVSTEGHHAGILWAQQTLGQGQDGGEVSPHDLQPAYRQHRHSLRQNVCSAP